ncbi:MAG: SDR family NAD(P)-dependent oxidoreductase [Rickettsiales bacterium]|jgi:short-subunit dehydrogenase|nr:SDR family NAD(P)-dependent oxidoreductase [Rickettsiales bacterium]
MKKNNILITGASGGLGRAIALEYAAGNTLHLLGRNRRRLEETAVLCQKNGAKTIEKIIDVADREAMHKYLSELKIDFDLVFANAGISKGTSGSTLPGWSEDVYKIFDTNIYGVINTIIPILPAMIKRKMGKIVIVSSMAGFRGLPSAQAYSASKACVMRYGEALNNYLKNFNVGVSVICPGFVDTPLTALNNFYMPFLMSPEKAAKKIRRGVEKNKKFIIFPKILRCAIKLADCLPFGLGDQFFSKLSKKIEI